MIGVRAAALCTLLLVAASFAQSVTAAGRAGDAAPALDRVKIAEPPRPIGDFELLDQDAQPFRPAMLRGRPALVFFGFTSCPDVCPTTLGQLRRVKASANPIVRELEVVLISVDGARDTPAVMKQYLAEILPGAIGLTGDPGVVRDIAARFSAVFFKGLPDDAAGSYMVEHSSQVYLLDSQGLLRATFYNAPPDTIELVATDILRGEGP